MAGEPPLSPLKDIEVHSGTCQSFSGVEKIPPSDMLKVQRGPSACSVHTHIQSFFPDHMGGLEMADSAVSLPSHLITNLIMSPLNKYVGIPRCVDGFLDMS